MALHPPTIRPHNWFLGNMQEFNGDTLGFLEQLAKLGDVTSFRFGPFRAYFANHPDHVHDILVNTEKTFAKSQRVRMALDDIAGDNIFTSTGEYWKRQRKLMQPSFHTKRIGAYADTMVSLSLREIEKWHDGTLLSVDEAMTSLTMNIITKTMFDTEVGDETLEIGHAFGDLLQYVNSRTEKMLLLPSWLPTAENRDIQRLTTKVRGLISGFIKERRASGEDKGDLLSMLLNAKNEDDGSSMSDEQIMNEAIIIFGAGHETTAYTLTFALYALAQNPHILAKLQAEVDAVLAGRPATLADLSHLKYTDMVIKEALRLYPPAWGVTRDVVADTEIGGYPIKQGSVVMVAPWTLGRDARWFPDPLTFDPERFTPENEAKLPKYAYIPFGGGPRVCIGNQFAMMEARLILATIAQQFSLEIPEGFTTKPIRAFTLRPDKGMNLVVRQRESVLAY